MSSERGGATSPAARESVDVASSGDRHDRSRRGAGPGRFQGDPRYHGHSLDHRAHFNVGSVGLRFVGLGAGVRFVGRFCVHLWHHRGHDDHDHRSQLHLEVGLRRLWRDGKLKMSARHTAIDGRARSGSAAQPALRTMRAIGTTAIVAVTEPSAADRAATILREELVAIDDACSRFRDDSEVSALQRANGTRTKVSALLFDAIRIACDVARRTDGAVDPTVGVAVEALGYDRDFAELDKDGTELAAPSRPAPGWWQIELDPRERTVRVPRARTSTSARRPRRSSPTVPHSESPRACTAEPS